MCVSLASLSKVFFSVITKQYVLSFYYQVTPSLSQDKHFCFSDGGRVISILSLDIIHKIIREERVCCLSVLSIEREILHGYLT